MPGPNFTSGQQRAPIARHDGWNGWKFQRPAPRKLLALERDAQSLRLIAELAGLYYRVVAVQDLVHAMTLIEAEPDVAVVVASQPDDADTLAALEVLRLKRPLVRRVLIGECPAGIGAAAVRAGTVQRSVARPLDREMFLAAIRPAGR
jgi:hypothetical protein